MRAAVAQQLRALGKQMHNVRLVQLAAHAESDPFGKVRGLIEGMIAKLVKAAAEEADQKAFCDEEKSKSMASKGKLNQKLDKVSVRIEKAEAGKAKLREQIQALEAEIADIDAGSSQALKIRQDEHGEFVTAAKEYKDSAAAIARAITVLDEYYSGAATALVQTAQPDFGGAKGDVSATIVGLLEVAESDFTRLLSEAQAEEESAENAYKDLVQESKVTKASKQADIKGKKAEVNSIETALLNYKEDHSTLSDEIGAVLSYLDRLKPQCETKVMTYAQKKAKREQEIEGLREALSSLSSEALVQTKVSLRGSA
jgi:chromosome segregation ATPase